MSIHFRGVEPFFDLHVPHLENYCANGVVNHNSGKTATEIEWARKRVRESSRPTRGALVARTAADVRDTLVQGDSGFLSRLPPSEQPDFEPSKRLLTFPNGSTALCFSSEEPSQLRGPQFDWAICDELSSWRWLKDDSGLTAWDNVRIATRLGSNPQLVVGTTPKRLPAIRELLNHASLYAAALRQGPAAVRALPATIDRVIVTRGSTRDNLGNLSATYVATVYGLFEGTSLARQELEGELLDDVEGALWTSALIDAHRLSPPRGPGAPPMLTVVGVDPSVAENPTDECGIIVAASTTERDLYRRHLYVLEDRTVHGSPSVWAEAVARASRAHGNAPIIAEVNQGGALVRDALVSIDPSLRVLPVRARYGKLTRAEPVALAFEQGRVHLPPLDGSADPLSLLVDQLTSWTPADRKSPDRLDSMVWSATALLVAPPPGLYYGPLAASSAASTGLQLPPSPAPVSPLSPSAARTAPTAARARASRARVITPGPRSPAAPSRRTSPFRPR